jgi:hypothetical protein
MWQLLRRLLLVNDDQADDAKAQVAVTVAGSRKRPVICVQIARDAIVEWQGYALPAQQVESSLAGAITRPDRRGGVQPLPPQTT